MKYLLLLGLLSGCAVLPQTYDAVLYDHYVQATMMVKNTSNLCDYPQAVTRSISNVVDVLNGNILYATYRNEPLLISATTIVRDDLVQFLHAYTEPTPPTVGYCRLKMQIEEQGLNHILEAIGGKPQ
jgi:hypothetical protein